MLFQQFSKPGCSDCSNNPFPLHSIIYIITIVVIKLLIYINIYLDFAQIFTTLSPFILHVQCDWAKKICKNDSHRIDE